MSFENVDLKKCIFCLKQIDDGVDIFGEDETALTARHIINTHFWFDLLQNNDWIEKRTVCFDCWSKVKIFHEFYVNVVALYNKSEESIAPNTKKESHAVEEMVYVDNSTAPDIETESYGVEETVYVEEKLVGLTNDAINFEASINETKHRILQPNLKVQSQRIKKNISKKSKAVPKVDETNSEPVAKQQLTRPKYRKPQIEHIICYKCHKSLKSIKGLKNHLARHDPKESFQYACEICDKKFPAKESLSHHKKFVHDGVRCEKYLEKTTCPICGKVLKYRSLKLHITHIHEKIPRDRKDETFMCEICAKAFTDSSSLSAHTLTHLNAEFTKMQCEICGKWLKNKLCLRIHKRNHEKVELKCEFCGKIKFTIRSLRSHITTAHSVRRHQCNLCDKSFTRPLNLKEHYTIHTGESLYTCLYCPKTFKNKPNMYKHMRNTHAVQWNHDRVQKK